MGKDALTTSVTQPHGNAAGDAVTVAQRLARYGAREVDTRVRLTTDPAYRAELVEHTRATLAFEGIEIGTDEAEAVLREMLAAPLPDVDR